MKTDYLSKLLGRKFDVDVTKSVEMITGVTKFVPLTSDYNYALVRDILGETYRLWSVCTWLVVTDVNESRIKCMNNNLDQIEMDTVLFLLICAIHTPEILTGVILTESDLAKITPKFEFRQSFYPAIEINDDLGVHLKSFIYNFEREDSIKDNPYVKMSAGVWVSAYNELRMKTPKIVYVCTHHDEGSRVQFLGKCTRSSVDMIFMTRQLSDVLFHDYVDFDCLCSEYAMSYYEGGSIKWD